VAAVEHLAVVDYPEMVVVAHKALLVLQTPVAVVVDGMV